jgi:hypothetical protein
MIALYAPICLAALFVIAAIVLMIYSRRNESRMPDWYQRYWCAETDENGDIIWKQKEKK